MLELLCPWCHVWEGEPKDFDAHLKKCKNNPVKQNSQTADVTAVNVSEGITVVVREQVDSIGNICFPLAKSPKKEYESCMQAQGDSKPPCIAYVLMDLIVAERVAQRQYDELLQLKEMAPYMADITRIRDDEYEHEQTLTKMLSTFGYRVVAPSEPGNKTFRLQKI